MTRCAALLALLLVACAPAAEPCPSTDAGASDVPCTYDEDCANLGPYGYCRLPEGEQPPTMGVCVID